VEHKKPASYGIYEGIAETGADGKHCGEIVCEVTIDRVL
jgi:hypothetical protein